MSFIGGNAGQMDWVSAGEDTGSHPKWPTNNQVSSNVERDLQAVLISQPAGGALGQLSHLSPGICLVSKA
jgi:hypothetical protein